MIISGDDPQSFQLYEGIDDLLPSSAGSHSHTLLYNLSVLRDKVQQVQSLVVAAVSPDRSRRQSVAAVVSGAGALIQEIIVAASSMMYPLQQMAELPEDRMKVSFEASSQTRGVHVLHGVFNAETHCSDDTTGPSASGQDHRRPESAPPTMVSFEASSQACGVHVLHFLEDGRSGVFNAEAHCSDDTTNHRRPESPAAAEAAAGGDIIELDAADLLGKYTHYCHVCGKGFKRDANLRMHMRAHGDEYKTAAALRNPTKGSSAAAGDEECSIVGGAAAARKYSCPEEGCRWNRRHPRFQPLKSMICVKNHYRRSHCPKLYACDRCKRKQFSVLSDLRTHEKHCGDRRWLCTCGTTFSRKDKLMGHVALFVGHAPALDCFLK